jgi:hypothetical protein
LLSDNHKLSHDNVVSQAYFLWDCRIIVFVVLLQIMKSLEHIEQKLLVQWFTNQYPKKLIFAIPNGGLRNIKVAMKLKAEGVKAGVLDICIPEPHNGYHGLFIEMKHSKGANPTDLQQAWIDALNARGYKAICCKGFEAACKAVKEYFA